VPLMTIAAPGAGAAHAWQIGTFTTLCGASTLGMQPTGSGWPPEDGQICGPCHREHRVQAARRLWAQIEDYLNIDPEPWTRQTRAGGQPGQARAADLVHDIITGRRDDHA